MNREERNLLGNRLVLWVTSFVLLLLELQSLNLDSHYKFDFFFLLFALWGVFILRDKIKLYWFHFLLFAFFLLLHNLGTFGTYAGCFNLNEFSNLCTSDGLFLGLEYDFFMHTYFGIITSFILYRSYHLIGPYKGWFIYFAIIAVILGISAFHELFEFGGAMVYGDGDGVLLVGAGDLDPFDTQKDLLNNFVGGVVGLLIYAVWEVSHNKEPLHVRTKTSQHYYSRSSRTKRFVRKTGTRKPVRKTVRRSRSRPQR